MIVVVAAAAAAVVVVVVVVAAVDRYCHRCSNPMIAAAARSHRTVAALVEDSNWTAEGLWSSTLRWDHRRSSRPSGRHIVL